MKEEQDVEKGQGLKSLQGKTSLLPVTRIILSRKVDGGKKEDGVPLKEYEEEKKRERVVLLRSFCCEMWLSVVSKALGD